MFKPAPDLMTRPLVLIAPLLLLAVLTACGEEGATSSPDDTRPDQGEDQAEGDDELYRYELPEGVPLPRLERPLRLANVELGRYLFYDTRLSGNFTQSCSSCHEQAKAFTDGLIVGVGSTGEAHVRNPMSLANVVYNTSFGWASPAVTSLEDQAAIPLFGELPVELGLSSLSAEELLARFQNEARYQELFEAAYPELPAEERVTLTHLIESLADFERTLISFDSPFDRYTYGQDSAALSPSQQRGMALFFSERLECFHCHGGFTFADSVDHEGLAFVQQPFHNTGLYNIDEEGGYPARDRGLYEITGEPDDMGRFKAPTLRNIAATAPYFHDGSAETLFEVIEHYERGGRAITSGEDLGDGSRSPLKSELVQGFVLTEEEREDLIAFLKALTDETFLSDPSKARPDDLPAP